MPAIYVDLDDVISETTSQYVSIIEHEFGKSLAFQDITSFDLKKSFSLTGREYEHFFDLVHKPEIILKFDPVKDAIDVLQKWRDIGFEIFVVTGRLTSAYDSSLEWLKSNRVPFDLFIMVDKYSRDGIDKKIAMSLESFSQVEFTVAVEDSVEMASFISRVMKRKVLLLDRPWNRSVSDDNYIQRCNSWHEVDMVFKKEIKNRR